jgi:predicted ester cyclase
VSTDANKTIVRRYIEEVLNQGIVDAADDLVASDFVPHRPGLGGSPGIQAVKEFAAEQRSAAPDWRITIEDMVAEGDRVVVRAFGRGTPTRSYYGMSASDEPVTVPWIAIYRLAQRKIAEMWVCGLPGGSWHE